MSSNKTTTTFAIEFVDALQGDDNDIMTSQLDASDAIYRVVLPIICTFGIVGLVMTLVVLSRKNMLTSTNCYLMAFSGADLVFLLLFASKLVDAVLERDASDDVIYRLYATYATILMNVVLLASVWLTVVLASERYVAISRPFLAVKFCNTMTARIVIAITVILSFVCRLPNFWETRVVVYYDRTTNVTHRYLEPTDFSYSDAYLTVYPWLVDGLLASILPFLFLLLLNVSLILEVRRSTRYLKRSTSVAMTSYHSTPGDCMTSRHAAHGTTLSPAASSPTADGGAICLSENNVVTSAPAVPGGQHQTKRKGGNREWGTIQKEEIQITVMLIAIIIVFFICQAPYVFYTAVVSIHRFSSPSAALNLFRHIIMLLLALKSAVNFIIYCWFSERFWATLKQLVCRGCAVERCCSRLLRRGSSGSGLRARGDVRVQSASYYSMKPGHTSAVHVTIM